MSAFSLARSEVKNPVILFSITSLCHVFEEWIPKLHKAMKSCLELSMNDNETNTEISLKYFLKETAFEDVSYLAQMCFDCGVYGLEGLQSLEDFSNNKKTMRKTSSSGSLVEQENMQITDTGASKSYISDELVLNTSERALEQEFSECVPTSCDVERRDESSQFHLSTDDAQASSLHSDESTPLISINVVEEDNFNVKMWDEDFGENTLDIPAVNTNNDTIASLNTSPHEVHRTMQNSADNTVSSLEEIPRDSLLAKDVSGGSGLGQSCEQMCWQCENGTAFCGRDNDKVRDKFLLQQNIDSIRSRFLSYFFFLLDVKRLRCTLLMSRGDRRKSWRTFVDSISGEQFVYLYL